MLLFLIHFAKYIDFNKNDLEVCEKETINIGKFLYSIEFAVYDFKIRSKAYIGCLLYDIHHQLYIFVFDLFRKT